MQPRAGLPDELLGQRIVAHLALDPAARLALFRSCHGLARMVLLHAPSSDKRVTHKVTTKTRGKLWSRRTAALSQLLGTQWQPLPPHLDLELCVDSGVKHRTVVHPLLPPPPPGPMSHVSRLELYRLCFGTPLLATWQLHDLARWPHLQKLTISCCTVPSVATAPTQPLRPIPRLQSFTWEQWSAAGSIDVLALAANARRAHLACHSLSFDAVVVGGMQRLQRLTHLEVGSPLNSDELRALMQQPHPTLAHVTLDSLTLTQDLSQQPCPWRTLTIAKGLGLREAALLPLAGLERFSVTATLAWGDGDAEQCAAGVAALQRLHSEGRLALLPDDDTASLARWSLQPGHELVDLGGGLESESMPALLRLVVEAGRGMNALVLPYGLPLASFRAEVVPLLESAHIHTLCVELGWAVPGWCAGFFGALPPSITNVQVYVFCTDEPFVPALVRGGAEGLRHPLTLTLVHSGAISAKLEAEVRQLAAGGGAGAARHGQPGSLLTIEVVS